MNIVANFEHGASSSRGKHEGESSFALCDRLGRTRDNSQRQLPTDHDYAVPTREYQTDQSSLKLLRLLLALSSRKRKDNYKNISTDFAELTRSLHIRAMRSSRNHWFVFRLDGRQLFPYPFNVRAVRHPLRVGNSRQLSDPGHSASRPRSQLTR